MKRIIYLSFIILILFISPAIAAASVDVKSNEKLLSNSISSKNWINAGIYSKRLAVYYDEKKQFDRAVVYYNDSAGYWTKAGHADWGVANLIRANHIGTELDLYVESPLPLYRNLGKFEPTSGTYLGLYLAGKRENANPDVVEDIYGKNHAIYLTYAHWRKGYKATDSYFPIAFAEKAKKNGSAIQVAWEPSFGLDDVKDDAYVRQFAREAKETDIPIFLRFAGEMNGEWVPWADTPKKFIEKFRLIAKIMKEEAPNVAMVWAPNFMPVDNIDEYYPGDAYVDWVGVSLYTIPFSRGEVKLGGNPIDYLEPIYKTYDHKPIMIAEGAVSHVSYEQNIDYSDWAASQIGNMYGFLPKMFPQVKAITYFNLDKSTTSYDNQNNNYDLGDSKVVDDKYQKMIQHPYFIDHLKTGEPANEINTEFTKVQTLKEASKVHEAFVYAKLPLGVQPYYVAVYQGDKKIAEAYNQPWEMKIDFSKIKSGQALTLIAFDKNFKRLATKNVNISFKHVSQLGSFTDVKASHWAFEAIEEAHDKGVVTGYPGGAFQPERGVGVQEFVTMLARAFGHDGELSKKAYPAGVLDFMKKMNYPHGNKGNAVLTRTEAAEIISGTQEINITGDDAIKYLLIEGLSNGTNPNKISVKDYNGNKTLTRAESITFIDHIKEAGLQNLKKRPTDKTDATSINEEYKKKFE